MVGLRVASVALTALLTPPAHAGEIEVAGPAGALRGTFLPAQGTTNAPAVLILAGSGPVDRDGNASFGTRAAPLRRLAEALARRGVASLRVDKRGVGGSAGDGNDVVMADYVADVQAWIAALRARTGASCIWIAGHSEGGLVALLAARADASGLCGLVLLAAPGRPMGTILREQLRANPGYANLVPEADKAIAALERGERVDPDDLEPALAALFRPAVQRYLSDAMRHDPAAIAARTRLPLVVIEGTRDIQIAPGDADRLLAARPDAWRVTIKDMNHVLSAVPSADLQANLLAYGDPERPLAPGLADAVSDAITGKAETVRRP